jgi:hypothetical protein
MFCLKFALHPRFPQLYHLSAGPFLKGYKRCQVFVNPLLTSKLGASKAMLQSKAKRVTPTEHSRHILPITLLTALHPDSESATAGHSPIHRPEASWRRMLMTQPPLYSLSADFLSSKFDFFFKRRES